MNSPLGSHILPLIGTNGALLIPALVVFALAFSSCASTVRHLELPPKEFQSDLEWRSHVEGAAISPWNAAGEFQSYRFSDGRLHEDFPANMPTRIPNSGNLVGGIDSIFQLDDSGTVWFGADDQPLTVRFDPSITSPRDAAAGLRRRLETGGLPSEIVEQLKARTYGKRYQDTLLPPADMPFVTRKVHVEEWRWVSAICIETSAGWQPISHESSYEDFQPLLRDGRASLRVALRYEYRAVMQVEAEPLGE